MDNSTDMQVTPMEIEVLELSSNGLTNKKIAGILDISERTVDYHIAESGRRLGGKNKTHTVANALRLGIIRGLLAVVFINALSANYGIDMRRPPRINTRVTQTRTRRDNEV